MGQDWGELLRQAMRDDPRAVNKLAVEAGLDQGQLSRFYRGLGSLTIDSAAKLATVLGLTLGPKTAETAPKQPRKEVEKSSG